MDMNKDVQAFFDLLKNNPLIINGEKKKLFEDVSIIKTDLVHIKAKLSDLPCRECFDRIAKNEVGIEKTKSWMFLTIISLAVSFCSVMGFFLLYSGFVRDL